MVGRSSWLARFNPGLSVGSNRRFDDSDPLSFYEWDDPEEAVCWEVLSGEPYRTSQADPYSRAHRTVVNLLGDIAVGDLIFVLRARPSNADRKPVADPRGWRHAAYLVGVWWVEATQDFPCADGWTYPLIYCAPLVKLCEPVPVDKARDWVPALYDVPALRVSGGAKLVTEGQAIVLAAACSLPMEIFTVANDELPALAAALRRLDTGPVEPMRKYLAEAAARYQRIRDIEVAAMVAVKDLYLRKKFAVVDVSRTRRIGFDLAVGHRSREDIVFQVEVKGTDSRNDTSVAITDHEYAAAEQSATASDGKWWLFTVTHARHADYQRVGTPYPASAVYPGWKDRVINAGAVQKNPLKRLDRLPKKAWTTPQS